ncbi:MAG: hypothetical protein MI808_05075 [Pseudomonadales bacterium]|nr:hypothetical protein [Pseudomonadales bacterium]
MTKRFGLTSAAFVLVCVLLAVLLNELSVPVSAQLISNGVEAPNMNVDRNAAESVTVAPSSEVVGGAQATLDTKLLYQPPATLASLQGTTIPRLNLDAQANLIKDDRIKRFFDYFLAAVHDADINYVAGIVSSALETQLAPEDAEEAFALWNRYLDYQAQLNRNIVVFNKPHVMSNLSLEEVYVLETVFKERKQLQHQLLGDVAASWFADDNAYDAEMLNRFKQSFLNPALLNPSLLNSSQSKVEEPFMPQPIVTSSEYEDQRRIILAAEGISAIEKSQAIASIRRDFFPERSDYLRQALKDLAIGD